MEFWVKRIIRIFLFFILTLSISCSNQTEICDLKELNLKGNVKSIEIITTTPIPISEWLYATRKYADIATHWSPERCYSFIGNSKLEFNKRGNIIKNIVYDSEGNQITWGKPSQHPTTLYKHFAIEVNELYCTVSATKDDKNRIIEEVYSHKEKDIYKKSISYNHKGDLDVVTCNYVLFNLNLSDFKIEHTDTLKFQYVEYDKHDNWIKALIISDGYIDRNDYIMEVTRQINYFGEPEQSPLIYTLQSKNYNAKAKSNQPKIHYKLIKPLNNNISIEVPINFEIHDNLIHSQNTYQYSAKNVSGYFSFSIRYSESADDLIYNFDSFTDQEYETAMRNILENAGIKIISWNGRGKTIINDRTMVWFSYYHYPTSGIGGTPIKVYIYQIQDTNTGIITTLTFGYDSAHSNEFAPQVNHMLNSISF